MPPSITPENADTGESPNQPPADRQWNGVSVAMLACMTALAALLRFRFLARKSFWFDECFSVEIARLPWNDFGRLLWRREANMSLYYLLLRGWLHFGSSPFFIRSLSVIFSVATLPAIFWLACKLFDRRVGLIAVALIVCNAYHIRYAQEARSYSLFVLLATLSSGFFVAALREPSRRLRAGYVLSSVLAVYAHLYSLLLLAAQWLSVRRSAISLATRRSWIWIGTASLPLVIFAAKTGAGPIGWIQRPGLHDLIDFAERICGNDGIVLVLIYASASLAAVRPLENFKRIFSCDSRWEIWRLRFLLIWLVVPAGLCALLSLARPLFLGRYFIFCLPALVILAASGLAKVRSGWMIAVCLAATLLLSLQGTMSYYDHDFDLERDGAEAATDFVLDHAQPGDAIVFHIAEARVPYEFFKLSERAGRSGTEPEIVFPRHGERLDYRDFTGKPSADLVGSLAGHYTRVWVVLMRNSSAEHADATTGMVSQILGKAFPRVERTVFPEVEVRLYERN